MVVTAVSAMALSGGITATEARADDLSPKEIFEKVAPATVQVLAGDLAGTGVIFDADQGLIVTNDHVIAGQTSIQVRIKDGTPVPVRVLASDPCEDLAVMKLATPQDDLKEVKFGDSGDLEQGDEVTAIGFPTAAGDISHEKAVLTSGVVQSPDVTQEGQVSAPNLPSAVQHSATLNEGNSGGPLLNDKAELVGINTYSLEGIEGQYYSISSDHAKPLLKQLAEGKSKDNPGWQTLLALSDPNFTSYFTEEDQADAKKLQKRLTDKGVDGLYVSSVDSNSPASKAVNPGEVITHLKGTPVTTVPQMCGILQSSTPGEKLTVDGAFTSSGTDPNGTPYTVGDAWESSLTLPR
ncbi:MULTISPECIES: S1C family serine protease [unclassified Streptomyces]|uniref:S1C family serine protease n=1 Tax=unclassified Streptomyces TaxID=2593676 RepID=UPI002E820A3D|nr:S1C family serine protease [Streptomyces sp. NBC_00589]WTI39386.1 S1C family serine protease [Streptomyces sp. NBC_00775]WUB26935.1 S1C family serine protease [Streptomyces sp. NBC_00589]